MIQLRPYQQEAKEAILNEFASGRKRTLLVLPTGCGKTATFCSVLQEQVKNGGKGLILAHREELLTQARERLFESTGLASALEKADSTALDSDAPVTVASVQTLCRESRLKRFSPEHYAHIVIDEAHHSLSQSYRNVIDYFPSAEVLGVTATPDRGDKKALGEIYESLAYEYPMRKAIEEGYLCRITAKMLPVNVPLDKVKVTCGDYSADELGLALDPYLEEIAAQMAEECRDRKTVVFLPLVSTAKKFSTLLSSLGIKAAEVDGESEDREETLAAFERGDYQCICNSMLLTEGWDCPSVDCVVVLRPTKVRSLYQQMVGRGTRLYPGKKDLLILDFLYLTERHDLCTPASLFCSTERSEKAMNALLGKGEQIDLITAEQEAEHNALQEREASLAQHLERVRTRTGKTVDPLQFALSIAAEDLASYEPVFGWELDKPTAKQLETIRNAGIDSTAITCKGMASAVIDKLMKRREAGLSTPKQIRCLERFGYEHVGTWSFEKASSTIDQLARNGWRI